MRLYIAQPSGFKLNTYMTYRKRVFKPFQHGIWRAIDTVSPPRCIGTGEIVDAQGTISPKLWQDLSFISAPYCHTCGVPFEFSDSEDVHSETICGTCLAEPPRYDMTRSALIYNDASRRLLLRFKYGDHQHASIPFARWIMMVGKEYILESDLIVPVPLHWQRLWQRRFNQSALIANALSKISGIDARADILGRKRYTGPQKGLSKKERQKNVRMAFKINPDKKPHVKGRKIILIDDVMTSGATLNECAKVLKAAGATKVTCLTLARVLKQSHFSEISDNLVEEL